MGNRWYSVSRRIGEMMPRTAPRCTSEVSRHDRESGPRSFEWPRSTLVRMASLLSTSRHRSPASHSTEPIDSKNSDEERPSWCLVARCRAYLCASSSPKTDLQVAEFTIVRFARRGNFVVPAVRSSEIRPVSGAHGSCTKRGHDPQQFVPRFESLAPGDGARRGHLQAVRRIPGGRTIRTHVTNQTGGSLHPVEYRRGRAPHCTSSSPCEPSAMSR
jgi:hypothetical protein